MAMISARPRAHPRLCAACARDVIRAFGQSGPFSHQWPRREPFTKRGVRSIHSSKLPDTALPLSSHQRSTDNRPSRRQNARRYASTHSENALREAVCNLADQITERQVEIAAALEASDLLHEFPQFSLGSNLYVVDAIRDYQKDLEDRSLLASSLDVPEELGVIESSFAEDAQSDDALLSIDPDMPVDERTQLIASQLGAELMSDPFQMEDAPDSDFLPRTHPLTAQGKGDSVFGTVYMPKQAMVQPVTTALKDFSNKHIMEKAREIFGGAQLPLSTSIIKNSPKSPIPLTASQYGMSPMEGNVFLSVLYPGIFAAATNVLVEVRKRLGTQWLRDLITKEGGPRVLDVGGAGAGILAWREILKAEYEAMTPGHRQGDPIPYGKSTVLTGSDVLRHRASELLENTTFIPRLPDYLHVQSETIDLDSRQHTPWRKEFDVIIASHSILPLDEDYLRRDHVRNLWLMLNPKGGVLILVEKGRSNGFEAIAGAREMILNRLISSPGSTQYENILGNAEEEIIDKEKGMIIAPCTNHSQCPLHVSTKDGRRPAWHCHFSQRYIRPPYLQRILGASDRNNEDVLFSYLAVQRGVDQREVRGLTQDAAATDVAFTGYGGDSIHGGKVPEEPPAGFDPLALPRIVSAPLKKKGHIIMDMCTPAGKMERWIVPRSFGKRAYRDARKSSWGDLWALGAKTRLHREVIRQKTPRAQKSEQDEDSANDLESEAVPGLVGARDLKGLSKYRKKVAKGKLKKAGRAAAQRPTDGSLEYDG